MKDEKNFDRVLEKYKFKSPVPGDFRDRELTEAKKAFTAILKKEKKWGIFVLLTASVFFLKSKMGLSLSFLKSAVVVGVATVLTGGVVITGTYYVATKYILPEKTNIAEQHDERTGLSVSCQVKETAQKTMDRLLSKKFIEFKLLNGKRITGTILEYNKKDDSYRVLTMAHKTVIIKSNTIYQMSGK